VGQSLRVALVCALLTCPKRSCPPAFALRQAASRASRDRECSRADEYLHANGLNLLPLVCRVEPHSPVPLVAMLLVSHKQHMKGLYHAADRHGRPCTFIMASSLRLSVSVTRSAAPLKEITRGLSTASSMICSH